jgi:hypothetical protein
MPRLEALMRRLLGAFLILLLSCSAAFAQQLVIRSAVPDSTAGTLFIAGQNFGASPTVEIDAIPVVVRSSSPELLLVDVPASVLAQPGSYLLSVRKGKRDVDRDVFAVTIGAVGPKGDSGLQGERGLQGPAGADGARGPEGPAGSQGERGPQGFGSLRVVDALGTDVGSLLGDSAARLIQNQWVLLPITPQGFRKSNGIAFWHETTNCSGDAYMDSVPGDTPFLRSAILQGTGGLFAFGTDRVIVPRSNTQCRSDLGEDVRLGNCRCDTGPQPTILTVRRVSNVFDLSGFVPPFAIR